MEPKLLFFDIDGTLAMPGVGVSDQVKEALEAVRKNGNYIFINTGRTDKDIPDYIKELDFDGGIYSAGGKVVFHDKVLSQQTLSPQDLKKIRTALDKFDIDYILEGINHNYNTNIDEFHMSEEEMAKLSTELQRFVRSAGMSVPKKINEYEGEPVYKVNFRVPEDKSELINKINEELGTDFRVDYFFNIFSDLGTTAGELTNFEINKGNGMKVVSDFLNIPMTNTIGFGDSTNDMDMIKAAELGVAMGNASADLIEAADFVCEPCLEDGVAKTLKRLELY